MNTKKYIPKGINFCYYPTCEGNIAEELEKQKLQFLAIKATFYQKLRSSLPLERYLQLMFLPELPEEKPYREFVEYLRRESISSFLVICPHCNNTLCYYANESTGEIIKTDQPLHRSILAMKEKNLQYTRRA